MRAWACSERAITAWARPGRTRSSPKLPLPVSWRKSSLRRTGWPMPFATPPDAAMRAAPSIVTGAATVLRTRHVSARLATDQRTRSEERRMAGEKRVAIVTGAASGIGRAMTLGLLEGGIDVAAVDKETAWLDELASLAAGQAFTGGLRTVRADLSDPASFETVVSAVLGASGRIDILVNNAGIGQGSIRADQRRNPLRFWEVTSEQWG